MKKKRRREKIVELVERVLSADMTTTREGREIETNCACVSVGTWSRERAKYVGRSHSIPGNTSCLLRVLHRQVCHSSEDSRMPLSPSLSLYIIQDDDMMARSLINELLVFPKLDL